jgi:hypothetical protein
VKLSKAFVLLNGAAQTYGVGVVLAIIYQVGGLRGLVAESVDRHQLVGYVVMLVVAVLVTAVATLAGALIHVLSNKNGSRRP